MKRQILVLSLLVLSSLATSCTAKEEKDAKGVNQQQPAVAPLSVVKVDSPAPSTVKGHDYSRKAEFVAALKEDQKRFEADMEVLSAKIDKANGAVKVEAQKSLETLRTKWASVKTKVALVESATEESWENLKESLDESLADSKKVLDSLRQSLSDTIAP